MHVRGYANGGTLAAPRVFWQSLRRIPGNILMFAVEFCPESQAANCQCPCGKRRRPGSIVSEIGLNYPKVAGGCARFVKRAPGLRASRAVRCWAT